MAAGICLVPDDRLGKALVPTMSIAENIGLHHQPRRLAWRRRVERGSARRLVERHQVVAADVALPIVSLSGGNQQKTIFARYLSRSPTVLLLDEPTRGIDIAAKAAIYDLLRESAADGMAVLVASSELEELIQLCHRVLVMFEGEIVASLSGEQLTEDRIAQAATGMEAA
jgi:ABC-type sugar transport system ATPase subunit